jgi:hypothetical protein
MKILRGFLSVVVLCLLVPPAFGQSEKITLYADAAGTDCSVTETVPGLVSVYLFHVGLGRRRASFFTARKPDCWTGAVWVGDVFPPGMAFIGNTQSDFSVHYCDCRDLPTFIGTINYFVTSIGSSCCEYPVLPMSNPQIPGSVLTHDCSVPFSTLYAIGAGKVTINETEDCLCDPPLAVEETTWGRVKALYH